MQCVFHNLVTVDYVFDSGISITNGRWPFLLASLQFWEYEKNNFLFSFFLLGKNHYIQQGDKESYSKVHILDNLSLIVLDPEEKKMNKIKVAL